MKGLSFNGGLLLLFIGLKLAGAISWPWLWVLAPAWIGLAIGALVLVVVRIVVGVRNASMRRTTRW